MVVPNRSRRSSLSHNVAMLAHTHDVDVGSQLCSLQFVSSPFELPRGTQGHSRRERKHHQQLPKLKWRDDLCFLSLSSPTAAHPRAVSTLEDYHHHHHHHDITTKQNSSAGSLAPCRHLRQSSGRLYSRFHPHTTPVIIIIVVVVHSTRRHGCNCRRHGVYWQICRPRIDTTRVRYHCPRPGCRQGPEQSRPPRVFGRSAIGCVRCHGCGGTRTDTGRYYE